MSSCSGGGGLQHTATHCDTLQHSLAPSKSPTHMCAVTRLYMWLHLFIWAGILVEGVSSALEIADTQVQHTATHCIVLHHTASHCITLQHAATRCNTLLRPRNRPHTCVPWLAIRDIRAYQYTCMYRDSFLRYCDSFHWDTVTHSTGVPHIQWDHRNTFYWVTVTHSIGIPWHILLGYFGGPWHIHWASSSISAREIILTRGVQRDSFYKLEKTVQLTHSIWCIHNAHWHILNDMRIMRIDSYYIVYILIHALILHTYIHTYNAPWLV